MDTRILSAFELRLNGYVAEAIGVDNPEPDRALFVTRGHPAPGHADADVIAVRERRLAGGFVERIRLTNHGLVPVLVVVELTCEVDFASLFEVKESRVVPRAPVRIDSEATGLTFTHGHGDRSRSVGLNWTVATDAADRGCLEWHVELAHRDSWEVTVALGVDTPRRRERRPRLEAVPPIRTGESGPFGAWRAAFPRVSSSVSALDQVVVRAREDLGGLRIIDPEDPSVVVIAAGAPWFMTLFGRDSLITAWMTLFADPTLARGVLRTLARRQGRADDAPTEEEPGKILHEVRFDSSATLELGGGTAYFGSVDATPLFVMLLGELLRWQPDDPCIEELWPAARAALTWIETHGDGDGDGYVEYERRSPNGLVNQGWKDSWDALRWADGTLVDGPVALCEVQGYVYAAFHAGARLARRFGDDAFAERLLTAATELRRRFNEDFWLDDRQDIAIALDRDKRPVDSIASNVGHCLWTGILDQARAPSVVRRLLSPTSFSGWGIRTLDTSMSAYNPVSYHNGSVWPHDNAICAAGLARYGFHDAAHTVVRAQLDVATRLDDRLPELFAGFDRAEIGVPAAYPTSCSPQAWASASPLLWIATILGLDPDSADLSTPRLPPWLRELNVEGVAVHGRRVDVTAT